MAKTTIMDINLSRNKILNKGCNAFIDGLTEN